MISHTKLRVVAGALGLGLMVVAGNASCEVTPQQSPPVQADAAAVEAAVTPVEAPAIRAEPAVSAMVEPTAGDIVLAQSPAKAPAKAPAKQEPKPAVVPLRDIAERAFPPTIPDTEWHQDTWGKNDCLRCHETGVEGATRVRHQELPDILLTAKCRTCHVFIPGSKPKVTAPVESEFDENAFPPMIPASASHDSVWWKDDCKLCHEDGNKGAPKIVHEGMPKRLLTAKCRTCHVQVRAVEAQKSIGRGR